MPVFVPQAGGCQDQIPGLHRAGLPVDESQPAFALDHEASGIGRMPVAGRDLAGEHELHAEVDRRRGLQVVEPAAGVGEHEHPPLRLIHRREFSCAQQQRPDRFPLPVRGQGACAWPMRRQQCAQARPQGHEVGARKCRDVVVGELVEGPESFHAVRASSRCACGMIASGDAGSVLF